MYDDGDRHHEDLTRMKYRLPDNPSVVLNPDAPSNSDTEEDASGSKPTKIMKLHMYPLMFAAITVQQQGFT